MPGTKRPWLVAFAVLLDENVSLQAETDRLCAERHALTLDLTRANRCIASLCTALVTTHMELDALRDKHAATCMVRDELRWELQSAEADIRSLYKDMDVSKGRR